MHCDICGEYLLDNNTNKKENTMTVEIPNNPAEVNVPFLVDAEYFKRWNRTTIAPEWTMVGDDGCEHLVGFVTPTTFVPFWTLKVDGGIGGFVMCDSCMPKTNNNKEANTMAPNTCTKCSGTGKYHTPLKDGSIGKCFACKGTGTKTVSNKDMTDKQVKFIRDLFKQVRQFMTEDQINNLVNAMQAHINGTEVRSTTWASSAIDKLKTIKANNA